MLNINTGNAKVTIKAEAERRVRVLGIGRRVEIGEKSRDRAITFESALHFCPVNVFNQNRLDELDEVSLTTKQHYEKILGKILTAEQCCHFL